MVSGNSDIELLIILKQYGQQAVFLALKHCNFNNNVSDTPQEHCQDFNTWWCWLGLRRSGPFLGFFWWHGFLCPLTTEKVHVLLEPPLLVLSQSLSPAYHCAGLLWISWIPCPNPQTSLCTFLGMCHHFNRRERNFFLIPIPPYFHFGWVTGFWTHHYTA